MLERELASVCGLSHLTARLLINRGILTPYEADVFLYGSLEQMHPPEAMRDLSAIVTTINDAILLGKRILVYGDYDVDGITATAILVKAIRVLGGESLYYIPLRSEGYGVHSQAIKQASAQGVRLVITVDCGVTAHEAVAVARAQGMELLITDHHLPQGCLPPTLVADPQRTDCLYPYKELAGAGVALKVAQLLLGEKFGQCADELLGLACLGTIADVVPLTGENRILVRCGLRGLRANGGLCAIASAVGLSGDPTVRDVAYLLAPRLNAAGRLGDPRLGVDLLLSNDPLEQAALAEELGRLNAIRKDLENRVVAEIMATVSEWDAPPEVAVFTGEGWHPGVIGIVASHMARNLERPVAVVAIDGDIARGSVRGYINGNMLAALQACDKYLSEFGGHRCAAGFTLKKTNLAAFIQAFAEEVTRFNDVVSTPLEADSVVRFDELSVDVLDEIEKLAPWGHGNPEPVMVAEDVNIVEARAVGRNGSHLKLTMRQGDGRAIGGIAFRRGQEAEGLAGLQSKDIVFTPRINEWMGRRSVELQVVDWYARQDAASRRQGGLKTLKEGRSGILITTNLIDEAMVLAQQETPPTLLEKCLGDGAPTPGSDARVYHRDHGGRLIDWRECWERSRRLSALLRDGIPTVIMVGTPRRAPIVATVLSHRMMTALETGFLHPRLDRERYHTVLKQWTEGRLSCLVVAAEDLMSVREVPRLVVYELPYDWSVWEQVVRVCGNLVLTFQARDVRANRSLLRSIAPGRECIAGLYKGLKQMNLRRVPRFSRESLASLLTEQLNLPVAEWTVKVGLAVLADLGLIEYQEVDNGARVEVRCLYTSKRCGLAASQTFRQVHALKSRSLASQRYYLQTPTHDIAATLGFAWANGGDDNEI